ncbi:LysR family transcriptional regulator [Nocardia bovistercoris]|uniref:LysR family transcriptional regulator n=1 Tax=Nocardia bovistercoris TaxID=2785916 RepID=A0A931N530_9NOCA|nr:LysR family transcriptional regulator [Nocardia bovistercoris]
MTDLDLAAVRAFVIAVDEGQFSHAATELRITQQAVSKRIAKLENLLGVKLFDRGRAGKPTAAGAKMLPHARLLLAAAEETVASVRTEQRPLRVAVLGERQSTSQSLHYYLQRHPESDIEIVISTAFATSRDALLAGRADAAFARPTGGPHPLPPAIAAIPAYVEPLHLLVGKDHPLAGRVSVRATDITPYPVWVPGSAVPSEWTDYYREWSEFTGITVTADPVTPKPEGIEAVLDHIATSTTIATFHGEGFLTPWHPHIRRVPITDPTPAYPHALLWSTANPHPSLPHLITYFRDTYNRDTASDCWIPMADRSLFHVLYTESVRGAPHRGLAATEYPK